jgi:hypothetical protein
VSQESAALPDDLHGVGRKIRSRVTIGTPSANACAIIIRSNGSRCTRRKVVSWRRCGKSIDSTEKPRFVSITCGSSGRVSFPDDTLIASSQSAATLTLISFAGSLITLRAAVLRAGDASAHQIKAWLSIRSRT